MEILFQGGADANLQNSYGKTVLMFAIQYDQLDVVRYLCEKKSSGSDIDFNLVDNNGKESEGKTSIFFLQIDFAFKSKTYQDYRDDFALKTFQK